MALFKRKNKKDAAASGEEVTDLGKAKTRRPASASPLRCSVASPTSWSARAVSASNASGRLERTLEQDDRLLRLSASSQVAVGWRTRWEGVSGQETGG